MDVDAPCPFPSFKSSEADANRFSTDSTFCSMINVASADFLTSPVSCLSSPSR